MAVAVYLHTSVVYMYADQCMLYPNHVIAVVVAEFERPKVAGLPHPNAEANAVEGAICESANREIEAQLAWNKGKKRKRSPYNHYDAETQIRMARCACEIDLTAMAKKFSEELGRPVPYTAIQLIHSEYLT